MVYSVLAIWDFCCCRAFPPLTGKASNTPLGTIERALNVYGLRSTTAPLLPVRDMWYLNIQLRCNVFSIYVYITHTNTTHSRSLVSPHSRFGFGRCLNRMCLVVNLWCICFRLDLVSRDVCANMEIIYSLSAFRPN